MGLDTSNDENINYEDEEYLEIDEEVDFEKELYCALNEIKKLTRKNQSFKEKLSRGNEKLEKIITDKKKSIKRKERTL